MLVFYQSYNNGNRTKRASVQRQLRANQAERRPRSQESGWEAKIWPTHDRETDCGWTNAAEGQSVKCRVRHSQEPTKNRSRCSHATVEIYGRPRTKMWPTASQILGEELTEKEEETKGKWGRIREGRGRVEGRRRKQSIISIAIDMEEIEKDKKEKKEREEKRKEENRNLKRRKKGSASLRISEVRGHDILWAPMGSVSM